MTQIHYDLYGAEQITVVSTSADFDNLTPKFEITDAQDKKFVYELFGFGHGEFKINRHSSQHADIHWGDYVAVRLGDDPDYVFGFFIEEGWKHPVDEKEDAGEEDFRGGRGTLMYAGRAILNYYSDMGADFIKLKDGVWRRRGTNATPGAWLQRIIAEANAHDPPTLPLLKEDFTTTTDSNGEDWPVPEGPVEYEIHSNFLDVIDEIRAAEVDIICSPRFRIHAYNEYSRDLSATVIFTRGVNIVSDADVEVNGNPRATRVSVRGTPETDENDSTADTTPVYVEVTDSETSDDELGSSPVGRREYGFDFGSFSRKNDLVRAGRRKLREMRHLERGVFTMAVTHGTAGGPHYKPFADYRVGDVVMVDYGGSLPINGTHRITSIAISETAGGEDRVGLTSAGPGGFDVVLNMDEDQSAGSGAGSGTGSGTGGGGGHGTCRCIKLCNYVPVLGAPDVVIGWPSGAGGVTSDASAILDGDKLSGDGTGFYIARLRGGGGAVFMAWNDPIELAGYTMYQGFSPEDPQFANTALVMAGWKVYVSNQPTSLDPKDISDWVLIEDADSSVDIRDSVHSLSPGGAWRWYMWQSDITTAGGPLQMDWVVREIEVQGVTSTPDAGDPDYIGTSDEAARCDHKHHWADILDAPDFLTAETADELFLTPEEHAATDHTGIPGVPAEGGDGGGAGSGIAFLDQTTLHATYGDDFEGANLDAKWTRRNIVAGDELYQQGGGSLLEVNMRTGATVDRYYFQPIPAGDFSIDFSFALWSTGAVFVGPAIVDSAGNGVQAIIYNSPNAVLIVGLTAYQYNGGNASFFYAGGSRFNWQDPLWIRLRKAGSTCYARMSANGKVWMPEGVSYPAPASPDRIGFGKSLGTDSMLWVERFNVL